MGHEIGGCFGCTDSAGTIFHAASLCRPRLTRLTRLTAFTILRPRVFVSFFPFCAKEENNMAPMVLIMMQMIAFQYSRERHGRCALGRNFLFVSSLKVLR